MNTSENNNTNKSLLESMKKKDLSGGFAVPENYFEMLIGTIEEKVRSIPNLVSIPRGNEFEVPENYFAELENSIREKISSESENRVSLSKQWFKRPKLVVAFATVLIFAIVTSTFIFTETKHQIITEKDISFNDIYSSDYANELDERSLVTLLEESSSPLQTSSQIEDYMIDNNIDILTLTEQL